MASREHVDLPLSRGLPFACALRVVAPAAQARQILRVISPALVLRLDVVHLVGRGAAARTQPAVAREDLGAQQAPRMAIAAFGDARPASPSVAPVRFAAAARPR